MASSRGSKLHVLKCHPRPFDAVLRGEKHHEVRRDDGGYRVGDHLLLRRYDPTAHGGRKKYTGRQLRVEVTHVTPGGELGLPPDLCVLSIAHLDVTGTLCCALHARSHHKTFVTPAG